MYSKPTVLSSEDMRRNSVRQLCFCDMLLGFVLNGSLE